MEDVAPFSLLFKEKSLILWLWLLWKLGYSTTTLYFGWGLLVCMSQFIPRDPISMVHNIRIKSGAIHLKKNILRGWLSFSWYFHYLCRDIWVWPHSQPTKRVMPTSRERLQCHHHECICNAIITSVDDDEKMIRSSMHLILLRKYFSIVGMMNVSLKS